MNLVAPIGATAVEPKYMPLFYLYSFDFLRKANTYAHIHMDGKSIIQDNFPFPLPKDLQWRFYSRYSTDCHMIEFLRSGERVLTSSCQVSTGGADAGIVVNLTDENQMDSMRIHGARRPFQVNFDKPFPNVLQLNDRERHAGQFSISSDLRMGVVAGAYEALREGENVRFELVPAEG